MTVILDSETDLNWLNEIDDGAREAARGLSLPTEGVEPWERAFHGVIEHALWTDATDRALFEFDPEEVPQFVVERLRQAVLSGALFSDFETVPDAARESVREALLDSLEERHGWSLDSIANNLQDAVPGLEQSDAERIARTETQALVADAREQGYREQFDVSEERFKWVGPSDARTTETCEAIKERVGEEGLALPELKDVVAEVAREHGHDPREWTPHVNCRHNYVRVVN